MTKQQIKNLIRNKKSDRNIIVMAIQDFWGIKRKYWYPYKED